METANLKILPAFEIRTDSVVVGDRVRSDFGDLDNLARSIAEHGLVQPIIVTSNHTLVAGERRLRAHKKLGYEFIKAVYIEVLDEGHKTILEATENLIRRDFDWKETVLAIDKVHRLKSNENALQGEAWGVRETGRLLNSSKSNIGRAVFIATYLRANDPEICKADNLKDAYAILLKRKEDELSAALVKQSTPKQVAQVTALKKEVADIGDEEFFATGGGTGFTPGIAGLVGSDERPPDATGGRVAVDVPLSRMFFHADSVTFCKTQPAESYDAVITDWPYGNDPEMMSDLKDFIDIEAEHQVDYCKKLHADIVGPIYNLLKPNGWFITWTDPDVWEYDKQLCLEAGFSVQRWFLVWHKTSACGNKAANQNFTKNHEIAIVCRKGTVTLIRPQASSVYTGGNDAEAKALGHPFCKPFALWEWLYNATCLRGASVLDPFVGRGSSTIPAIRFGLRPTGVEVNDKHFASLNVNLQNFYRLLDPTCTFS
jgi:DNA modification methylase